MDTVNQDASADDRRGAARDAKRIAALAPVRGSGSPDALVWPSAVFAFALLLRALELIEISAQPIFDLRMGDGRVYHQWALEIAAGDWIGTRTFYQAPGYPYFLASIYRVFDDSLLTTRVVQIVLGALACGLITRAGWLWFSKPIGILAGLLLAVYAPALFADIVVQKSVLDIVLVCALLVVMGGLPAGASPLRALGLGVTAGALILTRENTLVFLPILLAWLIVCTRGLGQPWRMRAGLFVLGTILVLAPVGLRNWFVGGEFHLTTSQFGHNLFIGNNPAADGTYQPLRYGRGDPLVERDDAVRLVADAIGRTPTDSEVSAFYTDRVVEFVLEDPTRWLSLMGRKSLLAINRTELVDTQDQYTHAEYSWVLWTTGGLLHFGLLAPLAFLGVCTSWRLRGRLWPLYVMVAAFGGSLLVFYIFSRYRLPIVPILVLFAAAALVEIRGFVRERSRGALAAVLAGTAAVALASNWPLLDEHYMQSVTHYNIANELVAIGETDQALDHYATAIRLHRDNAMANHNRGVVLAQRGDLVGARASFVEALRISPTYAEAYFNLARVASDSGDPRTAIENHRRGLEIEPDRPEVLVELGVACLAVRDVDAAIAAFERALSFDPGNPEAKRGLTEAREAGRAIAP